MSQIHLYPPSYSIWLADRLYGTLIETQATCNQCAMIHPEGLTRHPGPFKNELKCCTYFPFVPNFSIGAMILEKDPAIEIRLRTAEAQGLLLPLGLFPTPERTSLMKENRYEGFGQKAELLCPFFNSATLGCAAWKQRPGVCTTYFCKSDRGAEGLKFWSQVEEYLNHFEWAMAQEVFSQLGFEENEMEMCKAVMSTEENDEERTYFVQAAWGSWASKKTEFFLAAFEKSQVISTEKIDLLLGEDFLTLEKYLRSQIPVEK